MSIFRRIIDIARAEISAARSGTRPTKQTPPVGERRGGGHDYQPPPPPPRDEANPLEAAYDALEIPRGSDLATAKKAWRDQLRKYHPDIHSTDAEKQRLAHEVSQHLNQAYETIRQHYEG